LAKDFAIGDRVLYKKDIGRKGDIKGKVTYIIRDGSSPPWGYIIVQLDNNTSHICYPDQLVRFQKQTWERMMDRLWNTLALRLLVIFSVALLISLLLVKLLWGWAIPDIFPQAVEGGFIAGSISWFTAFKISIIVAFVAAFASIAVVRDR
jgi:hypothetical protein